MADGSAMETWLGAKRTNLPEGSRTEEWTGVSAKSADADKRKR